MAFYPLRRARLSLPFGDGIDWQNEFGRRIDWWWTPAKSLGAFTKSVGRSGILADPVNGAYFGPASVCLGDTFCVVVYMAFPAASIAKNSTINVGTSTGFRLETTTTGGGIYAQWTANGVANGADGARDGTASFDTRLVAIVSDWSSAGQTSWWRRAGEPEVTWTDSFNYAEPTVPTVRIGATDAAPAHVYAAFIMRGNVGREGARKLIADPWQVFV